MENKKCGETHTACNERLSKEGSQIKCCYCNPHKGCKLFIHKQEESAGWDWINKLEELIIKEIEDCPKEKDCWMNDIIGLVQNLIKEARVEGYKDGLNKKIDYDKEGWEEYIADIEIKTEQRVKSQLIKEIEEWEKNKRIIVNTAFGADIKDGALAVLQDLKSKLTLLKT